MNDDCVCSKGCSALLRASKPLNGELEQLLYLEYVTLVVSLGHPGVHGRPEEQYCADDG